MNDSQQTDLLYRVRRHPVRLLAWLMALSAALSGCSSTPTASHQRYATITAVDREKSEQLVQIARSMLGKPYHYGGNNPRTGFDCSGLVYYSHQRLGKRLPRSSAQQYRASLPVAKSAIKRGDLLFFRINRRKISHVGIYLGNNRFIHAPSRGKAVSIAELDSPYWQQRFVRGGRFF